MSTDYDAIAGRYRRAKQQPWRAAIEAFTLRELVGDVAGLSVVDLACGEGHYARILRRGGAASVVGIDLSDGMIALARDRERAEPLGIDYHAGDARDLPPLGPFDMAVAAYLLNYARDRDELAAMCRGVASLLRPGGRFVAINTNPDLDFSQAAALRRYDLSIRRDGEPREGAPITWTFHLDDGPLCVENYHLDTAAHEDALRAAGFRAITWHRPRLAPSEASNRDDWAAFLEVAPVVFLECGL